MMDGRISVNRTRYFESDGSVKPEALKSNPWLMYLLSADRPYVNPERLERMEDLKGNPVLDYVVRTLDILDGECTLDDAGYELVRTVLCWSEAAKAGSAEDRRRWINRGYPLEIHNEASALIYADHHTVRSFDADPVCQMIRTHGLAGQYIRGECDMEDSRPLADIAGKISKDRAEFTNLICLLNECIIRAVSDDIWNSVRDKIRKFAERLYDGTDFQEYGAADRLKALLPECGDPSEAEAGFFESRIFGKYSLWYFEAALSPFGHAGAEEICRQAEAAAAKESGVRHLNFKPLADEMYYDYEGSRHVNTYKQRIIEKYLENPSEYGKHVSLTFQVCGSSVMTGVRFAPACRKLIDFCVEAERSDLLSYEKSITMLYDMFGFRRDSFDRLNNEGKYLKTMNSAQQSTKLSILDYITGKSAADTGSGGGVLLDELEKRYPDLQITGTDISQNVIHALAEKKRKEGHKWNVIRHNFTEDPLPEKTDNVIFSSILHEIYSYTDTDNGKFNLETVKKALSNAVSSLHPGGRIIIRDGVKTPEDGRMKITFRTQEGYDFFCQFLKDFRGMDMLSVEEKVQEMKPEEMSVVTDINFGREFLYTYTWGAESFPHEVQECFGYFTISDFRNCLENMGMRIIKAVSFLEPGYRDHLKDLVDIRRMDENGNETEMEFPDSNCIVVAQKAL